MSLIRNAFKRLHYPVDIIAQCVRWYLTYSLSLRNLEEMMAERGIIVDHSTLHRGVIRLTSLRLHANTMHTHGVHMYLAYVESYEAIVPRGQHANRIYI